MIIIVGIITIIVPILAQRLKTVQEKPYRSIMNETIERVF